ncbi:hypothetical protein AALB_4369 [Agarivorans albus MKT 106]|uniref:DUF3149 domain-containing protein n=1 Tax=Agarivorans albus MKT 106 TaxID=1331007 RepID=R9PSG4_AGAAL|nr:hypothetical protein AALB_4369 [Agarivorans albus MKT 106]
MELWLDLLFGNSIGLMSVTVIATTIALMGFYTFYFLKKTPPKRPSAKISLRSGCTAVCSHL